jgi:hypothetical protein
MRLGISSGKCSVISVRISGMNLGTHVISLSKVLVWHNFNTKGFFRK